MQHGAPSFALAKVAVTRRLLVIMLYHTLMERHRRMNPDEPWAAFREVILEDPAAERDDHVDMSPPVTAFMASAEPRHDQHLDNTRHVRTPCERCCRSNYNHSRCWQRIHIDGRPLSDPPPMTRPSPPAQPSARNNS
jgi:hypothetical protein